MALGHLCLNPDCDSLLGSVRSFQVLEAMFALDDGLMERRYQALMHGVPPQEENGQHQAVGTKAGTHLSRVYFSVFVELVDPPCRWFRGFHCSSSSPCASTV